MTQADINRGRQEVQEGAQQWLEALQVLAEQIQKQQQTSQQMVQELMNTYMQLLNTPGSYLSGQAEQQQAFQQTAQQWMQQLQQQQQTYQQQSQQQQQAFQQMTQEAMNTYMQFFNIPASYAQEGLRTARRGISEVPIEGYDELTVEEVGQRLDELDADELRRVRDYEARNRNRATLIAQINDRVYTAS